jgi:hypothetical protein
MKNFKKYRPLLVSDVIKIKFGLMFLGGVRDLSSGRGILLNL